MQIFDFDDSYWPVLAALAWIARRCEDDVKALAFEMAGPRHYKREVVTPSGRKIAVVPSGPPCLTWLTAHLALKENQVPQATGSILSLEEEFLRAARAGKIRISGRQNHGMREELPVLALQDMHMTELYGKELVLEPGHWRNLLCKRGEVLRAFPQMSPQPESETSKPAKNRNKEHTISAVEHALTALFPNQMPDHCTAEVRQKCKAWLKDPENNASVRSASDSSIFKAFKKLRNAS